MDFLRFKLQELEELQLQEGEEVQLERELSVLDNYEKIATVTEKSYQALYGDRRSVYALLTAAVDSLNTVRQYDNSLDEMAKNLQDMLYLAEDYGLTLSGYSGKIDYDAQRRDRLNERKYTLDKAKRKYNLSIEELIAERERLQQEVLQLEHGDTELEDLQQLCLEKRQEFEQVALQVRDKRAAAGTAADRRIAYPAFSAGDGHNSFFCAV